MLLIQNITIADPKTMTETLGDLLLDGGKIAQIAGAGEIKAGEGKGLHCFDKARKVTVTLNRKNHQPK